ncbi:hypothetical protein GCM10009779_61380 [Polymorphospora rubra]|uniref:Uncharacterized protein n=2 Tax=Polymorphospora rubra TaxID=338584 RepID=A0A810MWE6_9ACTN|nr:hypothetical protein Prubr_19010 [Polymorphospora rubra]
MYLLPEDAWSYELTGPGGAVGEFVGLAVVIPDATPYDGPFTPMASTHVRVVTDGGQLPWPVLLRFVGLVETSGDIVSDVDGRSVTGELSSSPDLWRFADRQFEVDSYHSAERGCWCYELSEAGDVHARHDHLEVLIPDLPSTSGPPVPWAERAVFTAYGSWTLPWPVLHHFLEVIRHLLETCPSVVVTGLSTAQASELRETLRTAGATVDTRRRPEVR